MASKPFLKEHCFSSPRVIFFLLNLENFIRVPKFLDLEIFHEGFKVKFEASGFNIFN